MKRSWILSNPFSASIKMIMWCFLLLMRHVHWSIFICWTILAFQEYMHSCLPVAGAREWMDGCYYAKSGNWPKLTAITIQAFPWILQVFNRLQFQNSYVRQFLPGHCCRGGERHFWFFLLWHLVRIPLQIMFLKAH